MSETTRESTAELMQQIVLLVDKEDPAPEGDGLAAVALASVNAFLADPLHPSWRAWSGGPVGKSVRRADAKTFDKIVEAFADEFGGVEGDAGRGLAIGFRPHPKGEIPKKIAKLQVSGTTLPREEAPVHGAGTAEPADAVVLVLNDSLGMSTGKAAAQSAHALFAWLLQAIRRDPGRVDAWLAAEQPVTVRFADAADFARLARSASGPRIQDAGRTEIAPGSATAFVL
ncbi:peptidyl-tRNA hydrolase [Zhihengliuella halotolerans]|uniref:peptidyl-tRNA hydrolase n=1 Tax=Zhihengliuella halotolerans TaxID=370736 RepID=UPI000C801FDB|nr:peptidyl-tRNA hydrolase [Zhihengliuella halotolerans]